MKDKILGFITDKRRFIYVLLSILFIVLFLSLSAFSLVKLRGNILGNFSVVSSDNRVSVTIVDYNEETGFLYTDVKKVKIKANFNNDKNTNKKIIINVKEGLSYLSYPVLEVKYSNFEKKIGQESYLATAVKNVISPVPFNMEGIASHNPELGKISFGNLIYEINDNISSVEFDLNVKVDSARFYETKEIIDGISVQVVETDENNNEVISDANANIKLSNPEDFIIKFSSYEHKVTKEVFNSTPMNDSYGYTKLYYVSKGTSKNQYSVTRSFVKEIEYVLYYPEGTEFVEIFDLNGNISNENVTYTNFSDEHKVVVTTKWPFTTLYGMGVKYKVGTEVPPEGVKIAEAPEVNKIKVTYYDGVKKEYSDTYKYSVKILDANSFKNKLDLSVTNYYDDKDENTFIYGPMFVVKNNTPGTKTNQTLEFKIDKNYKAIKIHFPYDTKNSSVSNIMYKTTKKTEWTNYELENFNGNFTKKELGLASDEYFTAAKVTVSDYKEGYESSGSPVYFTNAVVYGTLKKEVSKATILFKTYDANNLEDTLSELEGTITNPDNNTFLIYKNSSASYNYRPNKEIVYTGETFTVNGQIEAHPYPVSQMTSSYVDNIIIYLRQPKSTTINPSTIKLLDKNNENVNYKILTKTNANNETVYILQTEYSVGRYFTEELIEELLKISYDIKVNLDFYNTEINVNDLITFGSNKNFTISSIQSSDDIFDINANGEINDKIATVGDAKIRILPNKNLAVSTYVEKDEIISSPYDPNNEATIMELHQKESFNYKIKIKNNLDYKVDGFELYLPIPKKNVNFGERFQTDNFNWDIVLDGEFNVPNGYSVFYTTEVPNSNKEYKDLKFSSNKPSNMNNVTMIKIYTEKSIEEAEEIIINIPFKINETRNELTSSANKMNVWNPVYYINMEQIAGVFNGTSVGARLLNHEITGKVFYDNNGNGLYDKDLDKLSDDPKVTLYKLNNKNEYELVENIKVSYDVKNNEFYFDDYNILKNSNLALKFDIPKDYFVSTTTTNDINASRAEKDGWIRNIDVSNAKNLNIGFLKYDLDFSVEDIILLENEKVESALKISSPLFFDYVKNENIAYKWELVNEEDKKYLSVENSNLPYTNITGISKKDSVEVKATIYDKYGNSLSKIFNVKIVNDPSPKMIANNVYINVGDKVEFNKYIVKAFDYKEKEIDLIWSGDKQNITYTSNIVIKDGVVTNVGAYEVTYTLKHEDKTAIKTIKIIVDDKKGLLNPQTQDKIKIVLTLLLFVGGTLFILKKISD